MSTATPDEENTFERTRRKLREDIAGRLPYTPITETDKALILEALSRGVQITQACEMLGIRAPTRVYDAVDRDAIFAADFKAAQAKGAHALLAAAHEFAVEELASKDPDRMRCADMMMRVTTAFVEKMAPREYGPLVKLGSDPDAPLQVQVVSYAIPTIAAIQPVELISEDTSRAYADQANNPREIASEDHSGTSTAALEGVARTHP